MQHFLRIYFRRLSSAQSSKISKISSSAAKSRQT
jgi:hypothetical protein